MQEPPIPADEAARLAALRALRILDTPPDPKLDRLTRLVAKVLDAPTVLVTLVDEHRQWFKSKVGMEGQEMPRRLSFCAHAVAAGDRLEIPDTTRDPRFADHPFVLGPPHIRFYAGELLRDPEGRALGTLCILGSEPRNLDGEARFLLQDFAEVAAQQLWLESTLRLKEHLLRQESLYRLIVENLEEGVVLLQDRNGILQANARASEILGLTEGQLLGRDSLDPRWRAVHEDGTPWPGESHPAQVALQTGVGVQNAVMGIHRPDGKLAWLLVSANPVAEGEVLVSFADVTEHRAAADALRRSEERYRGLVEALPDLMYRVNREGIYLDVVQGVSLASLAPPEEMLGRHMSEFLPPAAAEQVLAAHAAVLEFGQPRTLQLTYARSGPEREIEIRMSRCAPDECLLVVRDISERTAADRLKREFIATVSHELRTPLSAIRGALGLLDPEALARLDADSREMIEIARRNTERLMRLINDILDLEGLEEGRMLLQFEALDLATLARDTLESIAPLGIQYGVPLELGALPAARARVDGPRFAQALGNLLANAVKFSPKGEPVRLSLARSDGQIRIEVSNGGPGIPEAFRPRIFQRFAQADASDRRARGGTGLGLSITKALVERMGGQIGFSSVPGETVFHMEFPEAR
ncbi:MAG TPA: ATP-binding protein [Holophagaceae bacterium]|nr:ATP-binding protein [Holophagaceae bacterium]